MVTRMAQTGRRGSIAMVGSPPASGFFLVDTRPEHQLVSIGVFDVELEEILATAVKQSWNMRPRKLQVVDLFPIEITGVEVSRRDSVKDLGFLVLVDARPCPAPAEACSSIAQ